MPKKVPLGPDRRAAIADAAIHLVATRGLRGLTHRAVDAEAGLPPGSTSYYLRTRSALLTACVNRMLERDLAAQPATTATVVPSAAAIEELLASMVIHLVRDRPDDQVARYELSLEAGRQPELLDTLVQGGRVLREGLAQMLGTLGVPDPEEVAWPLAAMLDGLLWDRVAGAGRTMSPEAFESGVRRAVKAVLDGLIKTD
ncbi:TetR family transcriptional regulator [Kribbella amoyensis]|uniref:TetR family transcriptional regulator n=1 Tax=Kribbella amoyensis TaxID=996641 RepID=A0A561BMW7_9ACTN|nr:TetR family transcriptional regulator C-terminal domain-containing protein [Kribbella amoyensis]TWD80122.1 TetR family transcriptional regulator [Kribbella amoyensis]